MDKNKYSVNELYYARKKGAAPFIWVLTGITAVLLLVSFLLLRPMCLRALSQKPVPPQPTLETTKEPEQPIAPTVAPEKQAESEPTAAPDKRGESKPTAAPKAEEPQTTAKAPLIAVSPKAEAEDPAAEGFNSLLFLADAVEKVKDSTVGILNYQQTQLTGDTPYSTGSGFIVSEEGYVLTNAHVVEGAERLEVLFVNGTVVKAQLMGADLPSDIALLKIDVPELKPLAVGDSSKLRVGEFVFAIGNPVDSYQLYGSVSYGILSGLNREMNIDGYVNSYLQTDAAVNPGNSGGPLFNIRGEVIGMTTAKTIVAGYDDKGQSISAEGLGFALPIDKVVEIANRIILEGGVKRPGVGMQVVTLNEADAQTLGLVPGVLIDSVTPGGPAERAGLMANDVIVQLFGEALKDKETLIERCQQSKLGDVLELQVYRKGEYLEITVVIGDLNNITQ